MPQSLSRNCTAARPNPRSSAARAISAGASAVDRPVNSRSRPAPRDPRRRRPSPPRRGARRRPGPRLDDDLNGQAVLARELEVALVVGGHRHDRAGAVLRQHEVRDPDGHRPARERVDAAAAGVEALLSTAPVRRSVRSRGPERLHPLPQPGGVGRLVDEAGHQRMLGREQDERRPEDGVDAGREDLDLRRVPAGRPPGRVRPGGLDREPDPRPSERRSSSAASSAPWRATRRAPRCRRAGRRRTR